MYTNYGIVVAVGAIGPKKLGHAYEEQAESKSDWKSFSQSATLVSNKDRTES